MGLIRMNGYKKTDEYKKYLKSIKIKTDLKHRENNIHIIVFKHGSLILNDSPNNFLYLYPNQVKELIKQLKE
jgi:hypothetical protein